MRRRVPALLVVYVTFVQILLLRLQTHLTMLLCVVDVLHHALRRGSKKCSVYRACSHLSQISIHVHVLVTCSQTHSHPPRVLFNVLMVFVVVVAVVFVRSFCVHFSWFQIVFGHGHEGQSKFTYCDSILDHLGLGMNRGRD